MLVSRWLPVLLVTFSLVTPFVEVNAQLPDCSNGFHLKPHPTDCSSYYSCVGGRPFRMLCKEGLLWSDLMKKCDHPIKWHVCKHLQAVPPPPPPPSPGVPDDDGQLDLSARVNKAESTTKVQCGKVACKRYCPYGYKQKSDSCNTCNCIKRKDYSNSTCRFQQGDLNQRKDQPCKNLLFNDCTFGYRINADGCLTCECASAKETMGQKDVNKDKDYGEAFGVGTGDDSGGIFLDPGSTVGIGDGGIILPGPGRPLPQIHPQEECRGLPDGVTLTAHPGLCHRYYECDKVVQGDLSFRKGLTAFERECTYPLQFDSLKRRCVYFTQVACGTRHQEQDFCDYAANMCAGGNCRPCVSLHPSCRGMADGDHAWPGREGSGFYIECEAGRTVREALCGLDRAGELMAFDVQLRACKPRIDGVAARCEWLQSQVTTEQQEIEFLDFTGLLNHPECHRYYNCSSAGSHVTTCPYPKLWDMDARRCSDYADVACGARVEKTTPCDYKQCSDANWKSCKGLPDGDNVFRTRKGSARYVTCQAGRTIASHTCGNDADGREMHFSSASRTCVSVKT